MNSSRIIIKLLLVGTTLFFLFGSSYQANAVDLLTLEDSKQTTSIINNGVVELGEYEHVENMSSVFTLYWTIANDTFYGALVGQTTGYVALGINPSLGMKDADMIIAWVASGTPVAEDHFGTGATSHARDDSIGGTNDITTFNGTEINGITTVEYERPLSTGDSKDQDIPTSGSLKVIWAIGPANADNSGTKHQSRGSYTIIISSDTSSSSDTTSSSPVTSNENTLTTSATPSSFVMIVAAISTVGAIVFYRNKTRTKTS